MLREIKSLEKVKQEKVGKNKNMKICFLLPGIYPFRGGTTSILRLGTYLEEFGHSVYYATYTSQSEREMEKNAKTNLPYVKGNFLNIKSLKKQKFDIGVATYWVSVYYLARFESLFKAKVYFVQDFEPAFYPEGDLHYFALNSYKLGLHLITLGEWNKHKIANSTGEEKIRSVDFPFEIKQYSIVERDIEIKDRLNIALYVKTVPKRGALLLFNGLEILKDKLEKRGIKTEIMVFGLDRFAKPPIGKNMGRLTADQLRKLYSRCHIGMVASFTNISLVPYEMIASGLPVFEAKDGSAPFFFKENEMVFFNSYPSDIAEKVSHYTQNPEKLNKTLKNAQKAIKDKTWEKTAKQFEKIIVSL